MEKNIKLNYCTFTCERIFLLRFLKIGQALKHTPHRAKCRTYVTTRFNILFKMRQNVFQINQYFASRLFRCFEHHNTQPSNQCRWIDDYSNLRQ